MRKLALPFAVVAVGVVLGTILYGNFRQNQVARFIAHKEISQNLHRQLADFFSQKGNCACAIKNQRLSSTPTSLKFVRAGCAEASPVLISVGQSFSGLKVSHIEMAEMALGAGLEKMVEWTVQLGPSISPIRVSCRVSH